MQNSKKSGIECGKKSDDKFQLCLKYKSRMGGGDLYFKFKIHYTLLLDC